MSQTRRAKGGKGEGFGGACSAQNVKQDHSPAPTSKLKACSKPAPYKRRPRAKVNTPGASLRIEEGEATYRELLAEDPSLGRGEGAQTEGCYCCSELHACW